VPRGNKRFRRGEQQESFVTLMTGFFGRMGNSALFLSLCLSFFLSLSLPLSLSLSFGQKLASLFIEMKYLRALCRPNTDAINRADAD